jgi:hypothetical protein
MDLLQATTSPLDGLADLEFFVTPRADQGDVVLWESLPDQPSLVPGVRCRGVAVVFRRIPSFGVIPQR